MTKQLLTGALIAVAVLGAGAKTQVYENDEFGQVFGVSANGEYAAITDDENFKAYLWSQTTGEYEEISEELGVGGPSSQRVTGTSAYAVADDGTVVGSVTYADGVEHPAIYKDGEWSLLPMSEYAMNTNCAIAITPDCKYIGGYQFYYDPASAVGGRYRPCRWTLQEDGSYQLESYEKMDLLDHYGFFPRCMSTDGKLMGGSLYAGKTATFESYVNLETGELSYFHKFEIKKEPWEFKGKYYGGYDEKGNQIWYDDPNDPGVLLYEEAYIDGIKDSGEEGVSSFAGFFNGIDSRGCLYGVRSVASDVNEEDGTGTITAYATIYDTRTGEWLDDSYSYGYSVGLNRGQYIFGSGDDMWVDGNKTSLQSHFGFSASETIGNIFRTSLDGKVLGGTTLVYNEATGEPQYFPLIVVLDEGIVDPSAGVRLPVADGGQVKVNVYDGMIEVLGAGNVAIYDMQGRLVSRKAVSSVAPGIYMVQADGKVSKVLVK